MLIHLTVNQLITIEKLELELSKGTTVLTGETGAGKSILIDAIELALGKRATADMIRPGSEKAEINLVFDLTDLPEAIAWLTNYDLQSDSNECIIRRTLYRDGRSRSFINGSPTTLQPLREFCELLINIHSQHEYQSLLKPIQQRLLLDRYAGHSLLVNKVETLAHQWHALKQELDTLNALKNDRTTRSELLKFQLEELDGLHILPNEFDSLEGEHKQLAHAGELLENIHHALHSLADEENQNAIQFIHHTLRSLETIQSIHPKIPTWIESLHQALIHLHDTEEELRRYIDTVDMDPERLQLVEQRLTTLFDLARKHKIEPRELYDFEKRLRTEYTALETSDERLSELTEQLESLKKEYQLAAEQLSKSRQKSAKKLARTITDLIRELALPNAEFDIKLESEKETDLSPHGLEKIIFEVKTNAGQSLQPLAKIASGGELSRISLAIHVATAEQHTIPTLIFDEVDVGIGGGTAEIVGNLLRRLGNTHQVLCITHLPQVAAQGHHHLRVMKSHNKDTTETEIRPLTQKEKTYEIARMLGGIEITKTTLAHAEEMLGKNV